jgi:hypothetical protein
VHTSSSRRGGPLRGTQAGKRSKPIAAACINVDAVSTNFVAVGGKGEYVSFCGGRIVFAAIFLIFIESAKITDRVLKAAFSSAVWPDKPLAE